MKTLAFCIIGLLFLPGSGAAAGAGRSDRVLFLEEASHHDLTPYLEVLDRGGAALTIDQVSAAPWSGRFKPVPGDAFHAPSWDLQVHWLRFTAWAPQGSPAGKTPWLLSTDYVYLSRIDFYRPTPTGWEVVETGLNRPGRSREVANRHFVFFLPPLAGGPVTCYIRLETRGLNPLHFQVMPLPAFLARTTGEDYLFAVFYGILICMILYNLAIAIALRDRVYFAYVGYILFALASMVLLHGHAATFWNHGLDSFISLFWGTMGLYTAFAYLFMRGFLNTRKLAPLVDKLLWGGFFYGLLIVAVGLLQATWVGRWLTVGSGIFSPWLALSAGIVSLRRGFAPARYFLVAWGVLALAVTVFALQELGSWQGHFWARHSLLIGTALESILLSLGLAARIRDLNRDIALRVQMAERLTCLNRELEEANGKLQAAYQWMRDKKDLFKRTRYEEDIGFLVDREGRIQWVSETALSFSGRARPEVIGTALPDILPEAHREELRKTLRQARLGGNMFCTARFTSKEGRETDMDVKMTRATTGQARGLWVVFQKPAEEAPPGQGVSPSGPGP
jgi:PAS domain S-box-containing protein